MIDYLEIKFREIVAGMNLRINMSDGRHHCDGIVKSVGNKEVIVFNGQNLMGRDNNNYVYYRIIERDFDLGL